MELQEAMLIAATALEQKITHLELVIKIQEQSRLDEELVKLLKARHELLKLIKKINL